MNLSNGWQRYGIFYIKSDRKYTGHQISDTGYPVLDIRYWISGTGYPIQPCPSLVESARTCDGTGCES